MMLTFCRESSFRLIWACLQFNLFRLTFSSISSDWNGLCIEHALQNSSVDWCSSNWVEYIDSSSVAAIRGILINFLYATHLNATTTEWFIECYEHREIP